MTFPVLPHDLSKIKPASQFFEMPETFFDYLPYRRFLRFRVLLGLRHKSLHDARHCTAIGL